MIDTTPTDDLLAKARRWAYNAPLQEDPEEERRLYLAAGKALSLAMHRKRQETTEEAQP